jgi:hypothetical protein
MIITEKDIFNFVNSPDELGTDKFNHIKINELQYSELIDFYRTSLQNIDAELPSNISEQFNKIIPIKQRTIVLNPVVIRSSDTNLKFAADSKGNSSQAVLTFQDSGKKYLIKIINIDSMCQLHLFSKNENVKNVSLIIQPSGNNYLIKSDSSFIPIKEQVIDSIELTF